ncbi:putative dnaJ protein -like protein isoform 1 [Capsicum annuum]|uniref:RING-H2 finger protein ATL70 n=1 Tax=Capsicum annuum TaxID=4072 RepID=UPI0007BF71BE|nr:RING-H2 finger protein ATL70 [Capsicum annuum]KAF3670974.1 putative dnaJ protein -like protein isoform 1 [Capsicum annuum]
MNNTTVEDSESPNDIELSDDTFGKNYGYGIGFSLGILILLSVMAYASYLCIRSRSRNNSNVPNNPSSSSHDSSTLVDIQQGIDEEILRNYPKLLYSQAKVHYHREDNNGCSICLGDYKDNDMLRLLSNCGHIFHVKCIDPWLRLHPTCPICRNSPLPTPYLQ